MVQQTSRVKDIYKTKLEENGCFTSYLPSSSWQEWKLFCQLATEKHSERSSDWGYCKLYHLAGEWSHLHPLFYYYVMEFFMHINFIHSYPIYFWVIWPPTSFTTGSSHNVLFLSKISSFLSEERLKSFRFSCSFLNFPTPWYILTALVTSLS